MPTPSSRARLIALLGTTVLLAGSVEPVVAAEPGPTPRVAGRAWDRADETAARLVVTLREGTTRRDAERLDDAATSLVRFDRGDRQATYSLDRADVASAQRRLQRDPAVASVRASGRLFRDLDPTAEQYWSYLWGLHNSGQTVFGATGVADVDVDGREALQVGSGDGVVVAVIDDGVDFSRPDLAGQAWSNPGESGGGRETNGIDDDANGYVDDVHGWDFCHDDSTVHDPGEDFHGTHVAGTIAASLDGAGIVGVAPGVKIMALKFLGDGVDGAGQPLCGWDDQVIEAIAYARSFGVRISNNSWGRPAAPAYDGALYAAIADSGMLFVTSAGNSGRNNDTSLLRSVPASFDLANVLSVAAIDSAGRLASFSNYGATTVDIAAPGVGILSTVPAYDYPGFPWGDGHVGLNGTSMAAPHVTGIAALVAGENPALLDSPTAIKARILKSGKARGSTAGKTLTGRIVDALYAPDTTAPTAQPPRSYAFVTGTALGTTVRTRVRWPGATDDRSGVASYALRQSIGGAAWTTVTSSTTATSIDRSLTAWKAYRYRVRGHDRAGNTGAYVDGPEVRPTVTQQTSKAVTYGGTWSSSSTSSASGGSTRYATRAGAWVSYTFTGRAIAVVSPKASNRGSVRVYVDGAYSGTVSTYRSAGQSRRLVVAKNWGDVGAHTIKLVVVGTSGRPRFDIDAFVVLR